MSADPTVERIAEVLRHHRPGVRVAYHDGILRHVVYCACGEPERGMALPDRIYLTWSQADWAVTRHVAELVAAALGAAGAAGENPYPHTCSRVGVEDCTACAYEPHAQGLALEAVVPPVVSVEPAGSPHDGDPDHGGDR